MIEIGAPPRGDVVFLPTDEHGTPGPLNTAMLRELGLPTQLPSRVDLTRGFHFEPADGFLVCFIVTVGHGHTQDLLRSNLSQALDSLRRREVRSLWLPLMGMGEGGLDGATSLRITVEVLVRYLQSTSWELRATIAMPEGLDPDLAVQWHRSATRRLDPRQVGFVLAGAGHAAGSSAILGKADITLDPITPGKPTPPPPTPPPGEDPFRLLRSEAVTAVLTFANDLAANSKRQTTALSTALLFFALTESQRETAPDALREDVSARFFSAAVRAGAGAKYEDELEAYFGTRQFTQRADPVVRIAPTVNVAAILRRAKQMAGAADTDAIEVDDLIAALLERRQGRVHNILGRMGLVPEQLLIDYRDARLGTVATRFNNDVATDQDRLGYDSYASAICDFLTHADTPPPLSISIQAPWGGGKSSLMKLVRDRLDPPDIRNESKERAARAAEMAKPRPFLQRVAGWFARDKQDRKQEAARHRHLSLGTVLRLLDRKQPFEIDPDGTAPAPGQIWTIWFNAWKYETTEQVWAGLVDAIVSQVSDRLPLFEREKFLLKLQLARIDDGKVRRRIYDRVVTIWWAKVRAWVLSGAAAVLVLLGFGASKTLQELPFLGPLTQKLTSLGTANGFAGAIVVQILLSVYVVATYLRRSVKTRQEPANFSLADYLRVPDYDQAVGQLHQIHADLRKVLDVVPGKRDGKNHAPLVIFIDDLDRCSPNKVANVVEGVSMLLASEAYRCIFVIGMDPQMIAAALETAHKDVREQLPRYERAVPLGWRFMDKFVQLPFTIPPTTQNQFGQYVEWLATAPVQDTAPPPEPGAAPDPAPAPDLEPEVSPDEHPDVPLDEIEAPEPAQSAILSFAESRDVGELIRKISLYSVGNPREMKRMVNLARFYLALRSARLGRDDRWVSPDLDQYARWIALTLRWPDMLRWLQWGADEASWPPEKDPPALAVLRLRVLEDEAARAEEAADEPAEKPSAGGTERKEPPTPAEKWRNALEKRLKVPTEQDTDWACDPKLFEFFKAEREITAGKRLSDASRQGFW
ncbi:P-loop NTPase fold protein [Sphingomonas sp. HITSZ_GF]|uniref:KAP family P-loop NTPase fold protein n=1 Tax=Sphingomonas sp. HITSZ_GF TaxID=3037247 RepID=UPI00240DDAFE|nr:P-loop NTPase fold protein [Sphingomonas sp. HITSZ_GF]MDG2535563.1 P-loop NTPase fold protein [Sphingomonas sp. HITSZ_GF]